MPCARLYQVVTLAVLVAGCALRETPLEPALPAERWAAYDDAKGLPTADQIHWPPKAVLPSPQETQAEAAFLEAQRRADEAERIAKQRIALAVPAQAQTWNTPRRGKRRPGTLTSAKSIEQRYDYEPFKTYAVVSAPNHPTAIMLPPGEKLAAPPIVNACTAQEQTEAEGDKGCWSVGETDMGPEGARQHVIILRPSKAGLKSTMHLLAQSGRPYFMDLRSQEARGMLAVTWTGLPMPTLPTSMTIEPTRAVQPGLATVLPVGFTRQAPSISLDRLFTAYTIEVTSKQRPPWVPVQIFDDGTRTFIRFKENLAFTASPAVFGVHADRSPAIVEFTPYNAPDGTLTYIVNGLHPLLVLSGVDRMEVKITRGSHGR